MTLLDPRIWLATLLAIGLSYGAGRWQQWRADEKSQLVAVAQANEQARERERAVQEEVNQSKEIRDAEFEAINARLLSALGELRKRPVRLPETARPACQGATGAELSGRDAEFLAGLAARADKLRAELDACHGWIDAVVMP